MSNYPNLLTPPSSNEDSPQSNLYNSPPSSYSAQDASFLMPHTSLSYDALEPLSAATTPCLRIIEQPIDRFRFRYKSEMTGTHGSLCGQTSDRSRKQTYPTVELCNWDRPAIIRCSIYQQNAKEDNRPHAHRLIKKQGKGEVDDPHDAKVSPEDGYTVTFHSMGIIHTAKKNLVWELVKKKTKLKEEEVARKERKYRGLTQKEDVEIKSLAEAESKSINLNVVCLRFDAYFNSNGILQPICPPIYSHSINNLKSALTGELKIVRMDHCTSPAKGGREIFILVERVTKKNIKVRFYELDDDESVIWEDYGRFSDLDVHHQYAIVFKTPPYKDPNIKSSVKVFIELERPTDRARSEPKEFTYTVSANIYKPGAKRARPSYSSSYDTSLASDELPVPINNLYIENISAGLLDTVDMTSAELHQAMNNIDSDEFQRLFNDFGAEYSQATMDPVMTLDGSSKRSLMKKASFLKSKNVKNQKNVFQRRDSLEENEVARQALIELKNFMKTHPSDEKAVNMLRHYLQTENRSNPLHISIRQNEQVDAMFLLKMIFVWKQNDLLNVTNENCETALHIATYLNSEEIVANLIFCKADVSITDAENNTALHIALIYNVAQSVFDKLLSVDNVKSFIDNENDDGNTALNIAIENNNLKAVKALCLKGADVNKQHKKNGYTPLRLAIEKPSIDIIKFILQHSDISPLIEDFQNINALQAGLKKDNSELISILTDFMRRNDYCDVEVKNEIEDDEDEEFEEKFSVKLEQISPEELRDMYKNVKNFTLDCLDDIAQILDQSGTWQNLADLLDLGHLFRSGLADVSGSPTKLLLKVAVETNGDTVLQIREFLENLDEIQAVEIIDNMVKAQFV